MKNFFDQKYSKYAIRKFTIGVISATLGMFILNNTQISDNYAKAEDKLNIHYRYVSDDELTQKEKELIVKELPKVAESNEETYYLVYKPSQEMKLSTLPNTGIHTGLNGILLAGVVGMLVVAVTRGKNKKYKVLSVMLVTSLGISILQSPVIAMDSLKLSVYNTDFSVLKSGKLPNPIEIPGYNYVGFIKNEYTNFKINKTDKALKNIRNSDSSEGSRNRNIIKPEYKGEQSGVIVEPEKVEKPEYTGKIEPLKPETDKLPKESIMEKNASAMLNMRFISNNIENSGVGSATFISPNVLLSVAHNFITSSKDNMTGELIGSEKENIYEWITPDGKKGTFSAKDIHFYNKKEYPKGYINDLAVIKLQNVNNNQYVSLTSNYNKVNVGDKLNVYGYPKGKYTHLKDVSVELEQQYAKNTYGVQYQGGAPGMSGGGILNDKGEVIGIHQNGGQNRSGGLILSPNQLEWIKSIIEGKEITPKYDEIERPKEDKKEEKYEN
ncbi:trypsin-like peptidase domain-containing protein [Gemella morbillorum]|uniref:trypsin-like peptidase domain-containing protein n=1 Tax=Gemella morbillorum TaxID=29391 RepID=UPI00319D906D